MANGRTVNPVFSDSNRVIFVLPRGASEVRLVSRAQAPTEARPWLGDQRRLGVRVKRIVLRGFSMGGASSWHLGLHHPGMWAAVEAGAGYTETRRYGKRESLPPYQEAMLHYYDAVDYSLNAFNTPTVGYGGEIDAQLQASVNIREQLTAEGFRFQQDGPFRWVTSDLRTLFLIGPKTAHSWHTESRAESNVFINKALEKDRELRYQHAADIRADLKRLKRDTESGKVVAGNAAQVPAPLTIVRGSLARVLVASIGTILP